MQAIPGSVDALIRSNGDGGCDAADEGVAPPFKATVAVSLIFTLVRTIFRPPTIRSLRGHLWQSRLIQSIAALADRDHTSESPKFSIFPLASNQKY
jgi:hypothetical protein